MLNVQTIDSGDHEEVKEFIDSDRGLHCFIVVDSTKRGPSAGGSRLWNYASREEALRDALRLSRGMSYKNAMAGLSLGGGKSVIMKPHGSYDRETLFEAFGEAVDTLDGTYITAEDVGSSVDDMRTVARKTRYVSGITGGDPSPWTALGVFSSMREVVRLRFRQRSLQGLTVAVQGIGSVGRHLCHLLHEDGAKLLVSDIDDKKLRFVEQRFQGTIVPVDQIHAVSCDVFAPCALGGVLNPLTIPDLKGAIVCGAANNQLESDSDGLALVDRDITYVPDYVANAGGIINVAAEYFRWPKAEVERRVAEIPARVAQIYRLSSSELSAANKVADKLAAGLLHKPFKLAATAW